MNEPNNPSVNFYILPDSDINNRHLFVYRLVEKSVEEELSTLIIASGNQHLQTLDRLLWTVKPERFIAHEIINTNKSSSPLPTVVLSEFPEALHVNNFKPQIVIDLSYDGTPLAFPKIMLIANQHAEILANARMKYQSYVNQGIKPSVHKISEKQLGIL